MTLKALLLALCEMTGAAKGQALYARIVEAAPVILTESAGRVNALVVGAVIARESNFDPNALGRRGEVGLMQVKPDAAALLYCADLLPVLWEPWANVRCGVRLLTRALRRCTHLAFGLSHYNGQACKRSAYSEKVMALLPLRYWLLAQEST